VSELPATALLPLPAAGRRFTAERVVRLGDVDPSGELRLDAVARYLQDVASDDALDARLSNALGWVVRRTMMQIERPASVGERLSLVTYCTGAGRSWAERRTSIAGEHGVVVEAVSLWVHIEPATGRPARLGDDFAAIYGESASGRVVSSKLSLSDGPPAAARSLPWSFRRTDLDPFGHVNNAAHWAVLEEVLQSDAASRLGVGEIEYVAPAPADTPMQLVIGGNGHLDDPGSDCRLMWTIVDERVVTALRWTPSTASRVADACPR
jgi:acyl-ACP thioesterase